MTAPTKYVQYPKELWVEIALQLPTGWLVIDVYSSTAWYYGFNMRLRLEENPEPFPEHLRTDFLFRGVQHMLRPNGVHWHPGIEKKQVTLSYVPTGETDV